MNDDLSRRGFMRKSAGAALLAAPGVLPALGQNSKIHLGWIGVGSRGSYLVDRMKQGSGDLVQVTAVCDTYTERLKAGKDKIQTLWGNSPKAYDDFQQLLADPNVDAVVIATPEHLHYSMFMAALKAGKNIYVEKPLAHTIEQGQEMVAAAQKAGKVVQVGTQNRSNSLYQQAKQMVADGMIGDVHYVRAFWYRNSLDDDPAWRYKIPADANPQNTDWQKFLGSAPEQRLRSAALLSVAVVLGLLRRHLDGSAGPSDRHHQFRLRQDRAVHLHGVGRHLPVDRCEG